MKINILHKGDEVVGITQDFIAVKRKNKEVALIPLMRDETGIRIDSENIITIGYGNNTVEAETAEGIVVTNF